MTSQEKLQATLRELEQELTNLEALDAEGRLLLLKAMGSIQAKLQATDDTAVDPALIDQVHSVARNFEATHPTLSAVLKQIAEGLAQMGI